jgi:predicted metalloprotease
VGVFVTAGFFISLASFLSSNGDPVVRPTYNPASWTPAPDPDPDPDPDPTNPVPPGPDNPDVPEPDRNPPPLPMPETYTEATQLIEDNPVYYQSVAAVDCGIDKIDASKASKKELEAHLNELTRCLWQVWNPPLTQAGFALPRPPVTVYGSSVSTACGKAEDHNAVYCSGDQRIYYAQNLYETFPKKLRAEPFVADTVIAHEFGHAIQARTAILIAERAWEERESTSEAKANEYSRRTEMQADCLAGMFTSAVAVANNMSDGNLKTMSDLIYNTGDDVLNGKKDYSAGHGTGKARQRWFVAGQQSTQLGTCNTFTAESAQVR